MPRLRRALTLTTAFFVARRLLNGAQRPGEPPLVRGTLPHLGDALAFGRDATRYLERQRNHYGDVFTVFMAGERMTFVLDPFDFKAVLQHEDLSFQPVADEVSARAFELPDLRRLTPLDELEQLARDTLRGQHLSPLAQAMDRRLRHHLLEPLPERWREVGLYRFVWDTVFAATTDATFGEDIADQALSSAFEQFDQDFPRMIAGLPRALVSGGHDALHRLERRLRATGPNASTWMTRRLELLEGRPLDELGRSQVAVLWAVNANTIPTAFWSLAHLLTHDAALQRAREELETVLGTSGPEVPPLTTDQLDQLRWLEACIKESLRLTSSSMTVRMARRDLVLELESGPVAVRAGDRVCLVPHFTHFDAEIHRRPRAYDPERFFVAKGVKQFHKGDRKVPFPLMPFGAGVSMCPGRHFALNEIKQFVAMSLLAADVELLESPLPDADTSRAGLGIQPPAKDLRARLRRRV